VLPEHIVAPLGWLVIDGVEMTDKLTELDVTEPHELLSTQS